MIVSILIFLLSLSILIFVHELGHFLVARKSGVLVEEFGFGLPPRIFAKKIKGTLYSVNALPFGGFVRLHGEISNDKVKYPNKAFLNKSKTTRIKILTAGVLMNFLLAIFCFAIGYSFLGIPKKTKDVKIVEVGQSSPALVGGILVGDIVRKVDGNLVDTSEKFIKFIADKKGKKAVLEIERKVGEKKEFKKITLIPRENPPEKEGPLGVVITTTEIYYPPLWQRPFVGVYYGFKEAIFWGSTVMVGLYKMISELISGKIPQDVSGPVGIFAFAAEAAKYGIFSFLNLMGILSVNLAILNIIPFPALDGGRLAFVGIEAIIGKKVSSKLEAAIHTVGMIILLSLLFAVTVRDIQKIILNGGISGFLETVVK